MNIHLKTAWDHVRRSPFQAMAAIFVLAITFFEITLISVLSYASDQAIKYFETRPQVIVFLKDESKPDEISALEKKLENDVRVSSVSFVSKEEAFSIYKEATQKNPLLSELVSPSIFPASIEFSLKDITFAQNLIDEVKENEVVDQVGFTASLEGEDTLSEVVDRLRSFSSYVRVGGLAFAIFLISTSFIVLIVIIGMRITTRREEIEILDLIGATSGFIRSPIILEALIYAVLGVFSGWLIALLVVLYATPSLVVYFGEIPILPKDTLDLFLILGIVLGLEIIIGIILAISGSLMAVLRVSKK